MTPVSLLPMPRVDFTANWAVADGFKAKTNAVWAGQLLSILDKKYLLAGGAGCDLTHI